MMQAFILEIDVSQCLPAVIAHDESGADVLDGPGRREAASNGRFRRVSGHCRISGYRGGRGLLRSGPFLTVRASALAPASLAMFVGQPRALSRFFIQALIIERASVFASSRVPKTARSTGSFLSGIGITTRHSSRAMPIR